MNWINAFELLCYGITAMLLWDILRQKNSSWLRGHNSIVVQSTGSERKCWQENENLFSDRASGCAV